MADENIIEARGLTVGYGKSPLLENLNFEVGRGEIFGILGNSGSGKSTVLKHLIGLLRPMAGTVSVFGSDLTTATESGRRKIMSRFGVTYQGGALFGSMTLRENVSLPLEEFTGLSKPEIGDIAMEKLALVGLEQFADFLPSEISGGMMKRAGLARALALDPELLFFDEPSAGLDPIMSAELDRLILSLRDDAGATIVVVTHELPSIFSITDRVIILDKATRGIIDSGDPRLLREHSEHPYVREFLTRGGMDGMNKLK